MKFVSDCLDVNEQGRLTIGGADVTELAKEYGTPLYLMDENGIRSRCREYLSSLSEFYRGVSSAAFAGKAFCCTHMMRLLKEEGMRADVASGGELYTALKGGMPPEKLIFHGNNKTEEELRYAIRSGIGRIVANGTEELLRISRIAAETNTTAQVSLRLSPGIDIDSHSALRTGKLDTKFGIPIETGAALEAVRLTLSLDGIELSGIHCHLGSPIYETEPYVEAAGVMAEFIANVRDEYSYTIGELNLGGGYAMCYLPSQKAPSIREYMAVVADSVTAAFERRGLPLPALVVEPGRSIVAEAGITVYTAGSVKEIPGVRTYVSVDGGLTDNPRYMLYDSKYDITLPERPLDDKTQMITLAGRCCENELLGCDMKIQPVCPGDLVAVLCTGAYNYSMASHYNRVPKPPVVMVRDGVPFVAVRRETWEDVVRMDQ